MNKTELVNAVAAQSELTKLDAAKVPAFKPGKELKEAVKQT